MGIFSRKDEPKIGDVVVELGHEQAMPQFVRGLASVKTGKNSYRNPTEEEFQEALREGRIKVVQEKWR